ncbi:MAG: CoA transferase [Burkholderiales bacterium]|nr:CoA transferase [Burkholderiales bacterium]
MTNPLQGLRVLELGQVLAGPFAGVIFADLGAEVIKLERPDGGDDARRMGPPFGASPDGVSQADALIFHVFNRGKQSVALDLKSVDGKAGFERLLASSDIFLHNLRPDVPRALGIDGPTLCARHPRLVYCEISTFGNTGPMALQPGYEPLIQAFSGLSATNGGPLDPPMRSGASLCDQGTGMWAVIGALALLQRRQQTGRGGVVSASLLETALVWNGQKMDALVNEGRQPERHRSGHPGFVPYESFDTADEPLLICCGNDRLFAKLTTALEEPDWASDVRFATNRARLEHKAALLDLLMPVLRRRSRAHWLVALEAAGVPCAPIHSLPQARAHPQVEALGMLLPVPGVAGQTPLRLTALPLSIDGQRPAHRSRAPALGAHNDLHGLPALVPAPIEFKPGDKP